MKQRYSENFLFPQGAEDFGRSLVFPQGNLRGLGTTTEQASLTYSYLFPQGETEDYGRTLVFPQGQLHGLGGLGAGPTDAEIRSAGAQWMLDPNDSSQRNIIIVEIAKRAAQKVADDAYDAYIAARNAAYPAALAKLVYDSTGRATDASIQAANNYQAQQAASQEAAMNAAEANIDAAIRLAQNQIILDQEAAEAAARARASAAASANASLLKQQQAAQAALNAAAAAGLSPAAQQAAAAAAGRSAERGETPAQSAAAGRTAAAALTAAPAAAAAASTTAIATPPASATTPKTIVAVVATPPVSSTNYVVDFDGVEFTMKDSTGRKIGGGIANHKTVDIFIAPFHVAMANVTVTPAAAAKFAANSAAPATTGTVATSSGVTTTGAPITVTTNQTTGTTTVTSTATGVTATTTPATGTTTVGTTGGINTGNLALIGLLGFLFLRGAVK